MPKPLEIGVVMDPIEAVSYKKDSTLAMLWAAQERGWRLHYMEQKDLCLAEGRAMASSRPLEVFRDPQRWFSRGEPQQGPLSRFDAILMRKDPPFDTEYIYTTYLLEQAEREGVLVVNRPQSLRDCNEKMFAATFPELGPPTLVSRQAGQIRDFHRHHGDIIVKPLEGMGGASVFRLTPEDPNVSVILETLTHHGQRYIMAQRYLPEIRNGDNRILLIDGEPVPYALARIPAPGESRGNLAAGGTGEGRPLTSRDRWICAQLGPALRERGLIFVGIDVIGDCLTEINVTSPTCIRELQNQFSIDIAGQLMDAIARRLGR